ncbi:MAG: OmpH family outer membrane protein [Candidatus Omnitrophica bacterium]|nr:OmpH family outer membrane protein [Candidatus Omnitrophota bacterium]
MKDSHRFGFTVLLFTFFLSTVLAAPRHGHAAGEKVVFVDVAKVFDEYQKTKDQDKILQEVGKKKEQERDAVVHDIRKLKDELALLADKAKPKKQEQLDGKVGELQNFDRDAKAELAQKRNVIVREIFKDIDDLVQRYGERKGYDMILNERALLFRSPNLDVTQDVLKELNQNYAKNKK